MITRPWCLAALCCVMVLAASPALLAARYTAVNPTASTLSFTYDQFGSQVYGTFGTFVGELDFDTAQPKAGHARLTIELDSIDAGSADANRELRKPGWFDSVAYPQATFTSTAIEAAGTDRYRIAGQLTLKGITREVMVPVQLRAEGAVGIFEGHLTLKRSDFKVGAGEWASGVVSDDILIRFRMVAPER